PQFVQGVSGQALSFDGVDDYVSLGANSFVTGQQNRTFSAWIKPESDTGRIISLGRIDIGMAWRLWINGGNIRLEIAGSGYTTSLSPTIGEWNFVAATLSGSMLGDHVIYLDDNVEQCT